MFYWHRRPISSRTTPRRKLSSLHQRSFLMTLAIKLVPRGIIDQMHFWTSETHTSLILNRRYLRLNILHAVWLLCLWIIISIYANNNLEALWCCWSDSVVSVCEYSWGIRWRGFNQPIGGEAHGVNNALGGASRRRRKLVTGSRWWREKSQG